jgi:hypothetical protein
LVSYHSVFYYSHIGPELRWFNGELQVTVEFGSYFVGIHQYWVVDPVTAFRDFGMVVLQQFWRACRLAGIL